MVTSDEQELVHQLLEDVGILDAQFIFGVPRPAVVRTTFAPILRRWIVEGLFHKAQRLIRPHQIEFEISPGGQAIKLCKAGYYERWMGIINFGTIGFGSSQIAKKHLSADGKPAAGFQEQRAPPSPQRAHIFFDQRMFYWKEVFYTRLDIIKIHANSLGGVHFQLGRKQNEGHIDELKNSFGFEVKDRNIQMLIGADVAKGRTDPLRRSSIYDAIELISIDTASIFSKGVGRSKEALISLLR
jgi:hypothetical protein